MPIVAYLVAFPPSPPDYPARTIPQKTQEQAGDVHSFIRLADYWTIQKTRTIVRHSRSSQQGIYLSVQEQSI